MLSRWPRLRSFLKWTVRLFLLFLVLLGGVYLLRDKLLARPLASLVAEQMSAALGGEFTLERIEGNYFSDLVVVGLHTKVEPPEGPLRRIDVGRAMVRFSLRRMLEDPLAAVQSVEVAGLVLDLDLDRSLPPSEEPLDLADVLPKTFPDVNVAGSLRIRAEGRDYSVDSVTVRGSGSVLDVNAEGIDLAGELQAPLLRLRVERPEFGTFVAQSEDALAEVVPRRISIAILGDLRIEAELGVADGTIRATFTEQEATLTAEEIAVAELPAELIRRLPPDLQLPADGVLAFTARVVRPLDDDRAASATITATRLRWIDWSIDTLEVKGAWSEGVARLEALDVRLDDGFIRARDIELRPALDLPLIRLDQLDAELPDLRIPLRRLGIVEHLPNDAIAIRVRAHRAPGAPVIIDALALVAGPTHVDATGEFTLPTDVAKWEETPIALALDAVLDARSLPPGPVRIEGSVTIKGSVGGSPGAPTASLDVSGEGLSVDGQRIETLEAKGQLAWPHAELEALRFVAAPGSLVVTGSADLEQRSLKNGSYEINISDLQELAKLIPGAPPMKGAIRGSGGIARVSMGGEREGDADLVCEGVEIDGIVIDSAAVTASLRGDTVALSEFSVRAPEWSVSGSADADISFDTGVIAATLKTFKAEANKHELVLRSPLRVDWDGTTALVRDLDATLLGGRIRGGGAYGKSISIDIEGSDIDVSRAGTDAQGLLGFRLVASGTVVAPRWNLTIASSGLTIQQQRAKVDVRLRQDERGIHVEALQVDGVPNLSVGGSGFVPIEIGKHGIRLLDGEPALEMSVVLTPGGLAPYLPQTLQFSKVTFDTNLRGNSVDGTLRIHDPRWTEAPADFIAGESVFQLSINEGGVDFVLEGSDLGPLTAEARVHSGARLDWKDPEAFVESLRTAAIGGTASFTFHNLEPFVKFPRSPIAHGEGTARVEITLAGTPQKPSVVSVVTIESPRMRLNGDLPAMQDLVARLRVTEAGLTIERFEAQLGYAPLTITGGMTFPGATGAPVTIDVHANGKNLLLARTPYLRLRADLDLALQGPVDRLGATGAVTLTSVLWSQPLQLLSSGGKGAADTKLHLFSLRDEPLQSMTFDVAVHANETIRIDNNILRGALSANLNLRGTGGVPKLEGRVDFHDLAFSFPITRESLKIERGSLVFPNDDPFRPSINASCEARKLGYELSVNVTGKVPDVEVHITSIPALPREEAVLLLTTGTTTERLSASGQMTAGLYVGRSILDTVMGPSDPDQESLLDRFEFETGKDVSAAGDPTLGARFRLSKLLYLTAERDQWDDYNGGLLLRLRFR